MSIKGRAFIAGAFEHPEREIKGKSLARMHAEVAIGALKDAGLSIKTSTDTSAPATLPASAPSRWPSTSD
jgi:hypothetical protein